MGSVTIKINKKRLQDELRPKPTISSAVSVSDFLSEFESVSWKCSQPWLGCQMPHFQASVPEAVGLVLLSSSGLISYTRVVPSSFTKVS